MAASEFTHDTRGVRRFMMIRIPVRVSIRVNDDVVA